MIRAETLQIRPVRERRYQAILWATLAVAAYILAYSLATTNASTDFGDWPRSWEPPIQEPIDNFFEWFGDTLAWFFNPVSEVIDTFLAGIDAFLLWLPWTVVVAAASMLGLRLGGKWLGLFCGAATLFIGFNGYWDSAMLTISVLGVSVIIAVGIGVPIGIFAAFSNRFEAGVRPDSRHHAGPACLRIPHPSPGPVRRERNPGRIPYGGLLHSSRHKAHQLGDPPGPPGRYGNGPLARIDDVSDAVSGAAAAGKELDHVGHQPDHYDGSCHGDNNCPGGNRWARQDVWLSLREVDAGEGLESGIAIVLLSVILDRLSYALANSGPNSATSVQAISPRSHEAAGLSLKNMAARYALPMSGAGLIAVLLVTGSLVGPLRDFPGRTDLLYGGPHQPRIRLDGRQSPFHHKLGTGQPVPGTWVLTH